MTFTCVLSLPAAAHACVSRVTRGEGPCFTGKSLCCALRSSNENRLEPDPPRPACVLSFPCALVVSLAAPCRWPSRRPVAWGWVLAGGQPAGAGAAAGPMPGSAPQPASAARPCARQRSCMAFKGFWEGGKPKNPNKNREERGWRERGRQLLRGCANASQCAFHL